MFIKTVFSFIFRQIKRLSILIVAMFMVLLATMIFLCFTFMTLTDIRDQQKNMKKSTQNDLNALENRFNKTQSATKALLDSNIKDTNSITKDLALLEIQTANMSNMLQSIQGKLTVNLSMQSID